MAQIDWSLAQVPDFQGNALKAQQAGRQQGMELGVENALKNYAADPQGATQQLFQYDPRTAIALQDQQQQVAAQNAQRRRDAIVAAAKAAAPVLRATPPDQRVAKLAALAPALKQTYGLDDQTIATAAQSGLDDQTLSSWDGVDTSAGSWKEAKGADGSSTWQYLPNRPPPAYAAQEGPQGGALQPAASVAQQAVQAAPAASQAVDPNAPRSVRNNNPGNIEDGAFAQSLPGYAGTDGRFAKFSDPDAGHAAQVALLGSYGKRGLNTVSSIISRWAPPSDGNNTGQYVNFVARQVGVGPNQPLDMNDPATLTKVAQAIQRFEGGPQSVSNGPAAPPPAAAAPTPAQPGQARAPGYVNGIYTIPGDAKPDPAWKSDGNGFLRNAKTGDIKADPTAEVSSKLDADTVDYVAQQYVLNGQLPPLGGGKTATENRDQILARAAAIEKETGATGADAVARHVLVKTSSAALQAVTKQRAMIESFEDTAKRNGDLMLTLAPAGGGQSNIPVLNRWLQAGRQSIVGDPDVTKFNIALGTFADEYAKIVSGSTGSAGSTDSARKEAYDRLSKYATQGQLKAGIATMKQEMTNRTQSLRDQESALQETIRSGGKSAPTDSAAGDTAKPPKSSGARLGANGKYYAPDPNRAGSYPQIYQGDDGLWRMKSANGQVLKMVE